MIRHVRVGPHPEYPLGCPGFIAVVVGEPYDSRDGRQSPPRMMVEVRDVETNALSCVDVARIGSVVP